MNVLVTGLDGFVGTHLRRVLTCRGLEDQRGWIDLRDAMRVASAVGMSTPDAVVHLAAQASVAESFRDPRRTLDINFIGTFNLLNALDLAGFTGTFLYVSTGEVYGRLSEESLPAGENLPLRPRSPYAASKAAAEMLCYQWGEVKSRRVVIARPFNHIGPGQSTQFVVPALAKQVAAIKRGKQAPIVQAGNLGITRDFSDVRDVVRAYALLLKHGGAGEAYNVCSGTEYKISELLHLLADIAKVKVQIQLDPAKVRPAEQLRMCGDRRKVEAATGWKPEIPIQDSLGSTLHFWEEQFS